MLSAPAALLAFARHAQPPERQPFEILANRVAGKLLGFEFSPARQKLFGERSQHRAACMAGTGFERDRLFTGDRGILELRNDRARANDLPREQIGGAHQHADLHAALDERRGHGGHDRGGARVVHAAGKQHLNLGIARRIGRQAKQSRDHGVP